MTNTFQILVYMLIIILSVSMLSYGNIPLKIKMWSEKQKLIRQIEKCVSDLQKTFEVTNKMTNKAMTELAVISAFFDKDLDEVRNFVISDTDNNIFTLIEDSFDTVNCLIAELNSLDNNITNIKTQSTKMFFKLDIDYLKNDKRVNKLKETLEPVHIKLLQITKRSDIIRI